MPDLLPEVSPLPKNLLELLAQLGLMALQVEVGARTPNWRKPEPISAIEMIDAQAFLKQLQAHPSLDKLPIDQAVLASVPAAFALRHQLLPLHRLGGRLIVAHAKEVPSDQITHLFDELASRTGLPVLGWPTASGVLQRAIANFYDPHSARGAIMRGMEREGHNARPSSDTELHFRDSPIVDLVNRVIADVNQLGASDVHFAPQPGSVVVRARVDGVLRDLLVVPDPLGDQVAGRLKLLAGLNITEHRLPQDGRFSLKVEGVTLDIRVAVTPSRFGELVVLRLLRPLKAVQHLVDLGMRPADLARYMRVISSPHGIVLVTGPTGSGKSSTLYTTLQHIDRIEQHVITVEDPIEYTIDRAVQIQVNAPIGLTFASALRSILRADPDLIMIGEIRDAETLEIALHAAMTGHMVFSTVHANSAITTVERVLELGAGRQQLTSCVVGIVAQRLVRRICLQCRQAYVPDEAEIAHLRGFLTGKLELFRGSGCTACDFTGYKGRLAIFQVVEINDALAKAINDGLSTQELQRLSVEMGMSTLATDAIAKVLGGLTTLKEVDRLVRAYPLDKSALEPLVAARAAS